ncbi:MAG: DUF6290 family protein [Oscillospiraceae bacterium]|nr:DUF6290 family protein [Oscillospiraceae bacterium]
MMSQKEKFERTQERKEAATKKSTSVRLSDNEKKIINQKAKEKGMNASEYLRDCGLHGGESISPYAKLKIQNLVNAAYDELNATNPEKAKALLEEVKEVWILS